MLTIYLIRSGDTEYDGQGRIQGTLAVPLSADGRMQVDRAAEQLAAEPREIAALYAGPCSSVQQTAQIIGQRLKLKPKKLEKLVNLNQGLWQGMLVEEVRANQPKVYRKWQESPNAVCPPEGESLASARERLEQVLAKLAKKHKNAAIALVLPKPLVSVMRGLLLAEKLGDLWHLEEEGAPLWEAIDRTQPARPA